MYSPSRTSPSTLLVSSVGFVTPMENQQTSTFTPGWNDPPPNVIPTTGIHRLQRHKRLVDPSITGYGNAGNNYSPYQQQSQPQFHQQQPANPQFNQQPQQSFSVVNQFGYSNSVAGDNFSAYQQQTPQYSQPVGQHPFSAFSQVGQQTQINPQQANPQMQSFSTAPQFGQQHPGLQQAPSFPQQPYRS